MGALATLVLLTLKYRGANIAWLAALAPAVVEIAILAAVVLAIKRGRKW